jgi:hypothetical protein
MIRFKPSTVAFLLAASVAAPALAEPTPDSAAGPGETSEPAAQKDDAEPPLLFGRSVDVGGYGGLDVMYSRMFGQDGALVGVSGAILLDHRLSLGIAGYGWTNSQPAPPDALGDAQRFETGYGGVTVRYALYLPHAPVYLSVGALIGGGAIAQVDDEHEDFDFDSDNREDVFAVLQPDVTLHANLTPWMRLGVTAGYRFTSGVDRHGYDEGDVNGVVLGGQVQFGKF